MLVGGGMKNDGRTVAGKHLIQTLSVFDIADNTGDWHMRKRLGKLLLNHIQSEFRKLI